MKKIFSLLMATVLLATHCPTFAASARAEANIPTDERIVSQTTEYFDDGSYVNIVVTEQSTVTRSLSTYSKTGSKQYICFDKNKVELWRFTVYGTFTVDPGVSATCTSASYSVSISDDSWSNESASAYYYKNQAMGDAVFVKKLLFMTVDTQSCNVVLTCDSNGNLS